MKDSYITAVLEELKAGHDPSKVLAGLKNTLAKKGHDRLYAAILRGVARVLEAGSAESVVVTTVSEADYKAHKDAITAALKTLDADTEPKVQIDETIVGGFVAEANNKRIDASYKSKLVTLYRSLTK